MQQLISLFLAALVSIVSVSAFAAEVNGPYTSPVLGCDFAEECVLELNEWDNGKG